MNILYMGCHAVLEYDELRILTDIGHNVFSIGGYMDPHNPHVDIRPPLNIPYNKEWLAKFHHMSHTNFLAGTHPDLCGRTLTKEFLDNFDCVIVVHKTEWLDINKELFKSKLVILRTIGQTIDKTELELQKFKARGIKILRYSPKESEIRNYAGEDGMIRFLKYSSDFKPRNVSNTDTIAIHQNLHARGKHCGSHCIEMVADKIPFKLYGPQNKNYKFWGGNKSYSELIDILSCSGAFFYTGTYPAQYTLSFMEAMMSGIPVVSVGRDTSSGWISHFPYEVPDILDSVDSLYGDTIDGVVNILTKLTSDVGYSTEISNKQITVANKLFSSELNAYKWNDFLKAI